MKASKYFEMPTAELQAEYNSLKEKLFNLRFQHKAGQLESGKELTKCKKRHSPRPHRSPQEGTGNLRRTGQGDQKGEEGLRRYRSWKKREI